MGALDAPGSWQMLRRRTKISQFLAFGVIFSAISTTSAGIEASALDEIYICSADPEAGQSPAATADEKPPFLSQPPKPAEPPKAAEPPKTAEPSATKPGPNNIYAGIAPDRLNTDLKDLPRRVYVPHVASSQVFVIDAVSRQVIDRFNVGLHPHHIVVSWDLKTLWVTSAAERTAHGSVTPIDSATGKPGAPIPVDDPYNMYFLPDGSSAIVVAEAFKRLDFRDPHTMALQYSIEAPQCNGINHADFAPDGSYAIFTCEFDGTLAKIDLRARTVAGYLKLSTGEIPQDIRLSPDGSLFYVADMKAGGVFTVDGNAFKETGFIPTQVGAHGLYPSRDGTKLFVANRGSSRPRAPRGGPGSVSVIDFATNKVEQTWWIPNGGSPDMGAISDNGTQLWLSGRFDNEVYIIDTATGATSRIPVGREPHGLTFWPQPGRYSLGHTSNMR